MSSVLNIQPLTNIYGVVTTCQTHLGASDTTVNKIDKNTCTQMLKFIVGCKQTRQICTIFRMLNGDKKKKKRERDGLWNLNFLIM